jgi:hypothetical protein
MFPCPHCHKPIEIGIGPDGKVPWYRFDPGDPKVGLGCGTLFVIGIIVYFCSGGPLSSGLSDLRSDIRRLEKKVDSLADSIKPAAARAAEAAPIEVP